MIGFGIFVVLFSGCKTTFPSYDVDQPFKRSSISKDSLLSIVNQSAPREELFPLYAKGKLNVRQGDRSERGTIELYAYTDSLYAIVKNQVGIAGLEVWMINDRLILRDRVEKKTYRYTKKTVPDPLIGSLAQIPLNELLHPSHRWTNTDIRQIQDNVSYFRVRLRHQRFILIDKKSGQILRIDDPEHYQFPFDQIEYQVYRTFRDGELARRFRIFQPNSQTDIFLLLQELEPISNNDAVFDKWPNDPPVRN